MDAGVEAAILAYEELHYNSTSTDDVKDQLLDALKAQQSQATSLVLRLVGARRFWGPAGAARGGATA